MQKKIFGLVLAICMGTNICAYAAGESIDVKLDSDKVTMEAAGFQPGEALNMALYMPECDGSDTNENNAADLIKFVWEVLPEDDGSFSLSFNMPSSAAGRYNYVFKNAYNEFEDSFYYLSATAELAICDLFNEESTDFYNLLAEYAQGEEIILDITIDPAYIVSGEITTLDEELNTNIITIRSTLNNGAGFKSLKDIENTYNAAVLLKEINGADAAKITSLFDMNKDNFSVDNDDIYAQNTAAVVDLFIKFRTEKETPILTFEEVKSMFEESYLVTVVNITDKIDDMDKLISSNADSFGISKTTYESFTSPTIGSYLVGGKYTSYTDVKEKIEQIQSSLTSSDSTSSKPTVSRRGGGGFGITAPPVTQTPVSDDEVKVPFTDIGGVEWAEEAIKTLYARGIINGKAFDTFAPNDVVLREEFAKMIVNVFGIDASVSDDLFADVDTSAWYSPYITAAHREKIVTGMGDGLFGVGREVTRQDALVMMSRALKERGVTLTKVRDFVQFDDSEAVAGYARESVEELYTAGIINGVGDNKLAPDAACTRAQVAKMLFDILKIVEEK